MLSKEFFKSNFSSFLSCLDYKIGHSFLKKKIKSLISYFNLEILSFLEFIREMLVIHFDCSISLTIFWMIVSVFISFPISEFSHELCWSVANLHWNREISVFFNIFHSCFINFFTNIAFWRFPKIDCKLEEKNSTFWHSDFLNCIIDLICKQKSIIIHRSDIFTCKTDQSSSNIKRILSCNKHSLNPITSSMWIRITERFMYSRNHIIVFFTITIIIDLRGSCLNDSFFVELAFLNKE